MFVGKSKSLPYTGALERCFTRVGSGLTANIRLGWKGFHGTNTLNRKLRVKKFYNIGPRGEVEPESPQANQKPENLGDSEQEEATDNQFMRLVKSIQGPML